jgi:CheY-like chemotaxis protein
VCQQRDQRLNVLLTSGEQVLTAQLPRLLEPQGVRAIAASTYDQALAAIESDPVHMAVVDLALPGDPKAAADPQRLPAGMKLLQVINRLDNRPRAVVVVRGRRFDPRVDDALLSAALNLDVFSVLDKPIRLEQMLEVLRRALQRYYGGQWPDPNGTSGAAP